MSSRFLLYAVLVSGVLMLGACGGSGSGSKSSSGGAGGATVSGSSATVNAKKFCVDYAKAANLLQYGITDGTVVSDLKHAQAVAPSAVKNDVTKILNVVVEANSAKSPTKSDVTSESQQIAKWSKTNC